MPCEVLLELPPIHDPQRYGGLYVYDFGTHVSVGYTAGEIQVLRGSEAHRNGTAYEIYRVDDSGAMELRGVVDDRLRQRESICLLRRDGAGARRDYDTLRQSAETDPIACAVELELLKAYAFDPPNVTALSFVAAAGSVVSVWLLRHAGDAGDQVVGGSDARSRLSEAGSVRIASCQLRLNPDFTDRSAEEVLAQVDRGVQR